jgi:hypothetical protein
MSDESAGWLEIHAAHFLQSRRYAEVPDFFACISLILAEATNAYICQGKSTKTTGQADRALKSRLYVLASNAVVALLIHNRRIRLLKR